MTRLFLFLSLVFGFNSCISNHKPPIEENKIISFYTDYFIYTQYKTMLSADSTGFVDSNKITDYTLKKNKLTRKDLQKITAFYENNPIFFDEVLTKVEAKVDSVFKEEKAKK